MSFDLDYVHAEQTRVGDIPQRCQRDCFAYRPRCDHVLTGNGDRPSRDKPLQRICFYQPQGNGEMRLRGERRLRMTRMKKSETKNEKE